MKRREFITLMLDKWRRELSTHTSKRIPAIADPFWLWFVAIMAFAFILRLGLAIAFPNVFRPDEIGQNLEPAFRMWSGAELFIGNGTKA